VESISAAGREATWNPSRPPDARARYPARIVQPSPTALPVTPIGYVRSAATALAAFSHLVVVTYLHGASFDPARHLVRRPRGLASMPELGIFAQRAKDRPNPLGVPCVPLVALEPEGVRVRGLDAIDGTPVLDLKPYFPQFDTAGEVRVPPWVGELMRGYF